MAESFETANAAIVLPTLNEEKGLSATLLDIPFAQLANAGWRVRPLVVDGGSTDRTLSVAGAWGLTVLRQRSRGKGGAIREALSWLAEKKVQYALVLDADATYPGSAVLPALELLEAGSHLVVGVRQSTSGPPRSARDLVHRIGNALLNFVAGQFSRGSILDVCSGFWGVRVEPAQKLGLVSNDFGIEAELFLKGQRAGWTTRQIPIPYRERIGEAKLHAVADGIRILLSIIRFGHRTLQVAPEATSLIPAFLRDLMVTALIGGDDLVLVATPDRESDARAVARLLERSGMRPEVVVRPDPDVPAPFPGETPLSLGEWPTGLDRPVETPSTGPRPDRYVGPVIRFGAKHRALYVEMPDLGTPTNVGAPVPPSLPVTARSGAYLPRPRAQGDLFDPLRVLASRLNRDVTGTWSTFLQVNGLSVQSAYEDSDLGPNWGIYPARSGGIPDGESISEME